MVCGSRRWCVEVKSGVYKSYVVLGSIREVESLPGTSGVSHKTHGNHGKSVVATVTTSLPT